MNSLQVNSVQLDTLGDVRRLDPSNFQKWSAKENNN